MTARAPAFTFGIEEEYHLVDLNSRDLRAAPPGFMDACQKRLGERVSPEFLATQIEIGTPVCSSFADARAEVARLRLAIGEIAGGHGMAPIAAATHPFAETGDLPTTDKERYRVLARDLAGIGQRMAISGMHVHVGIEDRETRIDLMNQVRYFLPHLLVLSTSSPFWKGADTGLKSYRLAIVDESPRTGMPGRLTGWDEYQQTVDVLVKAGIIDDASKIWWDLRPSAKFPTLEMRITDVCTRLDDTMAVAALYICITRMLWRLRRANLSWRTYPVFLLEENRWRAQRYGVKGDLFDFGKGTLVPFCELISELTALVAEDAAALGCEAEIAHCRRIAAVGTSADRQVVKYEREIAAGRSRDEALRAVVDQLVAETLAV
ncbi:MAG: carboxylate-amine ligase [Hyphomicrobiaceae bacterium]